MPDIDKCAVVRLLIAWRVPRTLEELCQDYWGLADPGDERMVVMSTALCRLVGVGIVSIEPGHGTEPLFRMSQISPSKDSLPSLSVCERPVQHKSIPKDEYKKKTTRYEV